MPGLTTESAREFIAQYRRQVLTLPLTDLTRVYAPEYSTFETATLPVADFEVARDASEEPGVAYPLETQLALMRRDKASNSGIFPTMTTLCFGGERPKLLPLLSAPYIPQIASDVVIDLSHWQASVDFSRAKSAGIVAVILKATQGSDWIDVTFAQRFAAATASGLLVGAYHFLDHSPPEQQIGNFLSVAEGCSLMALDAEPNAIGGTVTVAQTAEAAGRLNMATGSMPLIYINRYGPDQRGTGFPNSVLSRCPLWLPSYSTRPVCPSGWSKWALWQYTDGAFGPDTVPVAGIGRCDRSRFAGTTADLVSWWKNPQL